MLRVEEVQEGKLLRRAHDLPHWQIGGWRYFRTFRSVVAPFDETERHLVMKTVRAGDGAFFHLHTAVVMPDHVHALLHPREHGNGFYDLARINKGIKGASARRVNELRGTKGQVWQTESYDRLIRNSFEFDETWNYIVDNPRRAGLCEQGRDYPWLYTEF